MDRICELFLEAMKAALEDSKPDWSGVTGEELSGVLTLAQDHHVLPMIFEAVYTCPGIRQLPPAVVGECRRVTLHSVMAQAVKTEEFLELYTYMRQEGLMPLVVKGIICRNLYPRPDYRHSGDEDVLCGEANFKASHKALIRFGMEPCSSSLDSYEVPYRKTEGSVYIELHKTLFSQSSDIFSSCNPIFDRVFDTAVEVEIQGVKIATMNWTDHMLYLILHAFKHFLHSGFGIRQVCDMILFANAYGDRVDWQYVMSHCTSLRAQRFAAAIFAIGEKYLTFSPEKACYPESWKALNADPDPLLDDLLRGGIYGSADPSRVHSCNMTLNAVEADKKGKRHSHNLLRTVFPGAKQLEGRFPWLKKNPWLLPAAWCIRIVGYAGESIREPASSAADVIRVGSQRVELLRQYDIID